MRRPWCIKRTLFFKIIYSIDKIQMDLIPLQVVLPEVAEVVLLQVVLLQAVVEVQEALYLANPVFVLQMEVDRIFFPTFFNIKLFSLFSSIFRVIVWFVLSFK